SSAHRITPSSRVRAWSCGDGSLSSLIPALLASICRASGNETFSISCTNAMTSPCLPQAQQRNRWRRGSTSREGRLSVWNGQSALKTGPAGLSARYDPTTLTMSLAAFTCLVSSTGSDGTGHPLQVQRHKFKVQKQEQGNSIFEL